MKISAEFGLGLLGMTLGMGFADIDSVSPILRHRSIVTHAALFPLIAWILAVKSHDIRLRLFTVGFSVAMAVHLSFDLWPRAWVGMARIHVPLYGRLSGPASWTWIALNILVSLYLASWLIWKSRDFTLAGLSLVIPFIVSGSHEAFWYPLMSCGVAIGLTFWFSEQENHIKRTIEGWTHLNAE